MKIHVVDTETGFGELEGTWNRLSGEMPPAIFSSFDYVRTAWSHFHKATDRLFLLVLTDDSVVRGIAPFYVARRWRRKIPHRVIQFIAAWEGDRPRLVTAGSEEAFWNEILSFLSKECRSWEVFALFEQPAEGPVGAGWSFLSRPGWYWERETSAVDYYISLQGEWEDYVKALGSQTRQGWRRKRRRLSELPGGLSVERISQPARIPEALSRFVVLEESGWKASERVGLAKDEVHRAFYEDLLIRLAARGQAAIYLLTVGEDDVAGQVAFAHREVIYTRQIAYLPSHAAFSPGIVLQAEIIRENCGGTYRELDLLGRKEEGPPPRHKADWATGRRETVQWTGYRVSGRLLPVVIAKRLKTLLAQFAGHP